MTRLLAAAVLAVLVAVPLTAEAQRNDRAATVMSRNLYFGADLTPAIGVTDPGAFTAAVTGIYAVVQASDIPGRAEALAAPAPTSTTPSSSIRCGSRVTA